MPTADTAPLEADSKVSIPRKPSGTLRIVRLTTEKQEASCFEARSSSYPVRNADLVLRGVASTQDCGVNQSQVGYLQTHSERIAVERYCEVVWHMF